MSTPSEFSPIFCCGSAHPVHDSSHTKLHNDPNRGLHEAIFQSFVAFAMRRQHATDLYYFIMGFSPDPSRPPTSGLIPQPQPAPIFSLEALENNPLTPQIPYVIHLTSRHDFGPVYSHRYFVCPPALDEDWVEVSLIQWFARGEPFKMKAEKWDIKCRGDCKFFRMTLRPNLAMRGCYPVSAGGAQEVESSVSGSGDDVSFGSDSQTSLV
ncbi:uncharacterized protein RSE6_00313 [Rhynchosporium secalis]|uniref:Uncharacterized protein n=1 Tax=Rhynchosporium secalis TaxID=38038 RepID=A0A1E1LUY3_RHYSE|nr:uncharacterized protein RSE6_00313 [Rhynchosporium secalis]